MGKGLKSTRCCKKTSIKSVCHLYWTFESLFGRKNHVMNNQLQDYHPVVLDAISNKTYCLYIGPEAAMEGVLTRKRKPFPCGRPAGESKPFLAGGVT
jgi:hypothetical protein